MGIIIKPVEVIGDRGRATVQALFDTGASASFIRREMAERIAAPGRLLSPRIFSLGDGKAILQAQEVMTVDIVIEGVNIFHTLLIVDELGEEMIVGSDLLQRWKIRLDPEREEVCIDPRVTRLRL